MPQSAYKSARATLRHSDSYGASELEAACALSRDISSPTKASMTAVVSKGIHHRSPRHSEQISSATSDHSNLGGIDFYKKGGVEVTHFGLV